LKILFDDLARIEYQDAIEFYELEIQGLGLRFKEEVKRALRNLKKFPNMGSIEKDDIRRYILHKFPYKILYSNEKKYLYVIAIAHMHREPNYWLNRI
jgi:plasmid stabilization system protein ParE